MAYSDRELLELAAKAAGLKLADEIDPHIQSGGVWIAGHKGIEKVWSPLANDGDAFRLAVKLYLDVMTCCQQRGEIQVGGGVAKTTFQPFSFDPMAATRRAIVRAAAEIGSSMTLKSDKNIID